MLIRSALKQFQAVITGITGGKIYRLPPQKENTVEEYETVYPLLQEV